MLFGRRNFLNLLGKASAIAAVDPTALARTAGDLYINDRLSLSMRKPAGWEFLSVVDYRAAAQQQAFLTDDPEVEQILKNPDSMPFLVITKFDATYEDLNPCITGEDAPIEPGDETALEFHIDFLEGCRQFLPGARVRMPPIDVTLNGGIAGTRSAWSFLLQHDSGLERTVDITTLLIFRPDRYHTFNFMHGQHAPALAKAEFEQAERSLTYW